MTSWNAAHDFIEARNRASRNASVSNDSSASFDPARTGDPSPALGHADLDVGYVGRGGLWGCPNRNPIGFAPAADPDRDLPSEPRFHTEISFKRHQPPVSPRAGSGSETASRVESAEGSEDRLAAACTAVGAIAASRSRAPRCSHRLPRTVARTRPGDGRRARHAGARDVRRGATAPTPRCRSTSESSSFRRRKPAAEAVPAPPRR